MALTATWYITEMTRTSGNGSWNITPNTSTEVHAWYGTQAEWNGLTAAQKAFYGIHIIEVNQGSMHTGLVDSAELRTALTAYGNYNFGNAAGPIGTLSVDTDNDPTTAIVPTVGVAIDGQSIESSLRAIVISLAPITATTLPGKYKGGASDNHFQPFKPGTLTDHPVCFLRGTMILTVAGEKPVEALAAGDLVMTVDNGPQPVALVMSTVVTASQLAHQPELRPIRIRKGALGPDCPADDLRVSPQHRMLVRSRIARHIFGAEEILVAAKQ